MMKPFVLSSPSQNEMRTEFTVKYPVELVRSRYGSLTLSLKRQKLFKFYPFLKDANYYLTALKRLNIDRSNTEKSASSKSKSKAEQKALFERLLRSSEVKNQSEIARKFDVSRAWVSIVLNS